MNTCFRQSEFISVLWSACTVLPSTSQENMAALYMRDNDGNMLKLKDVKTFRTSCTTHLYSDHWELRVLRETYTHRGLPSTAAGLRARSTSCVGPNSDKLLHPACRRPAIQDDRSVGQTNREINAILYLKLFQSLSRTFSGFMAGVARIHLPKQVLLSWL